MGFADGQGVVWRERKGTLSTARLSTEQLDIVEGGMVGGSCLDRKLAFGEGHLQCLAGLHLSQRQDSHQGQVG